MKKELNEILSMFVVMLFIAMPAVDAVSISNVRVTQTSDRYALINWQTDQPSSTEVVYGRNVSTMNERRTTGVFTKNHTSLIAPLFVSSNYYFNVSSSNPNGSATAGIFNLTTASSDTTVPFIDVNLPSYHGSTGLDIRGKTEPNSNVFIEVNGNSTRFVVTDNTGEFFFPSVLLKAGSGKITPNIVKVIVIDPSRNQNEVTFTVNVDKTPPGIVFTEPVQIQKALLRDDRSFAIGQTSFAVKGDSDEPAAMEITATDDSGEEVFNTKFNISSPWEKIITFPGDGSYTLLFYALDRAGNVFSERFVVLVDTKPLRIERTNLRDINPSYVPITKIKGKVNKPGALVVAVVNNLTTPESTNINLSAGRLTNIPTSISELVSRSGFKISTAGISRRQPLNYVTIADENGNFEIEIELTSSTVIGEEEIKSLGQQNFQLYSGASWKNHVEIIAGDAVGNIARTRVEPIYYSRCGAGGAFSVGAASPSPGSLPEPILESGNGMFSLTMSFAWTGSIDRRDVTIHSVRVTRQQVNRQDLLSKYNLTIGPQGLFSGGTVYPRLPQADTKQLYALIKLRPLTREIFPPQIPLSTPGQAADVFTAKLDFPLQLEIDYSYKDFDGKPSDRITQKTCIDAQIQVEPDASHFTKYIPTKLMKFSINTINSTLNLIDKTRGYVKQAQTVSLISCGAGIVLQGARLLANKWTCFGKDARSYLQEGCSVSYTDSGEPIFDCSVLESEQGGEAADKARLCLTDTYDTLQWQQYAVNLPCDRIFCPSIPSIDRHAKSYRDLLVKATVPIRQGESTRGIVVDKDNLKGASTKCVDDEGRLITVDNVNCRAEFNRGWRWAAVFHFPYDFSNGAYLRALTQQQGNIVPVTGVETFFQRVEQEVSNLCTQEDTNTVTYIKTKKKQGGVTGVETAWAIKLIKNDDDSYTNQIRIGTYEETNVIRAKERGENVLNPTEAVESTYFHTLADLTYCVDADYKCKSGTGCTEAQCNEAVVYGSIGERAVSKTQTLPTQVIDQLGAKRSKDYSFDPTSSIFNSARAMCFPALDGHLRLYRSLLTEAKLCLETVAQTGKGNPGVCNAFLANGICDLVSDAISCLGATASNLFGSQGVGKELNLFDRNPFKVITTAGESLSETVSGRYGGTAVYRSFFDQNQLVRSFCVAAFTGNWDLGIVSDLLTQATVVPVKPVCLPAVAERRFITSDPTKQGRTTYLYHVAGMLTAGSEITSTQFQLVCSGDNSCTQYGTSNPGGICDCSRVGEKVINIPNIPGNVRLGDVLNKEEYYPAPANDYRFDKFRITFNYKNNLGQTITDKCDTHLREEGFPPPECKFDLERGGFRCEFTIGDQGAARFVEPPKAKRSEESGQEHVYSPEDEDGLAFPTTIEVLSPDPNQQITKWARYTIRNQLDRVIFDDYFELDEGLHSYELPKRVLKQTDFLQGTAASFPAPERLNPSGAGATVSDIAPTATDVKFIMIFDKDFQTNSQFYCIGYEDNAQTGRMFTGQHEQGDFNKTGNSDATCNGITLKITNAKSISTTGSSTTATTLPKSGDTVLSYKQTAFRVSYAAAQYSGLCTTEALGWKGEVVLYHSLEEEGGNKPSVPIGLDDTSVKFNFKAQCQNTEGTGTRGVTVAQGRVRQLLIQKVPPDPPSIPTYNFTVGQGALVLFSVSAISDIDSMRLIFEKENPENPKVKDTEQVEIDSEKYATRNVRDQSQEFNIPNLPGRSIRVYLNTTLTSGKSFIGEFSRRININK